MLVMILVYIFNALLIVQLSYLDYMTHLASRGFEKKSATRIGPWKAIFF